MKLSNSKKFNLFIEKPSTLKSKHLKELIYISNKRKLILMSGYIYTYNTYIQYIKKIIKSNKLGNIKYIYFERSNLGPIRNDTSCLWDLASHDVSTAMYLLEGKPKVSYVKTFDFLKKKLFDISSVGLDFKKTKVSQQDRDALQVLELNDEVKWEQIHSKFKELVKKYHPDKNQGNKKFEDKLKIITLAYTQLKNTYRAKIDI